jgi:hypothetical protein
MTERCVAVKPRFMQELVNYNAARRALAEARRIDEVKVIKDKARALELYAIEAKDRDMELWAVEIRVRAERRAGELLHEMKETGQRDNGRGGNRKSVSRIADTEHHPPTLTGLGITRDQSGWSSAMNISNSVRAAAKDDSRPQPVPLGGRRRPAGPAARYKRHTASRAFPNRVYGFDWHRQAFASPGPAMLSGTGRAYSLAALVRSPRAAALGWAVR